MSFCEWPVSYASCVDCEPLALPAAEDPGYADALALRTQFEDVATQFLWNWTGQQFGTCPTVVRPCRSDCQSIPTWWGKGPFPDAPTGWFPAMVDGSWLTVGCGLCRGNACQCSRVPSLALPGPVGSVTEVRIDGVVLAPANYRVDNARYLVRTDGEAWPRCQDLNAATDQPNTFQVSYERGMTVPMGGQMAAGVLACELAKAACSDPTCGLPQRVQTVTRQGVTIAMLDSFDDIDTGHTGIWSIDSWVSSVMRPARGGSVLSPDKRRPTNRVTTWP